jgi:ring-1,2-phenylacetyl-CoA epoxidase subunit PaaE
MDEVFICGPEEMITATEKALVEAGVPADRVRTERFTAACPPAPRSGGRASDAAPTPPPQPRTSP